MQNLVVDIDTNGFRALGIACIRVGGYGSQAAGLALRMPLVTRALTVWEARVCDDWVCRVWGITA